MTAAGDPDLHEASVERLQSWMAAGDLTSRTLAEHFLSRIEQIDRRGPCLRSVIEVDASALDAAEALDRERRSGAVRGPLHGIPILLKDNLDTAGAMMTTAGSLALAGAPARMDSTVAAQLRAAGAVILGKANMSEWANFRSGSSTSGWSARGGQCRNPYVLDRNPRGSSSGSAAAVAGGLCAVAIGTETDGSIVSPAGACGVVGIKPSVGLVSRAGIVPISGTQDTAGPLARTVADAAAVLTAITAQAIDPRDPAAAPRGPFTDYMRALDRNGLSGARLGVARNLGFGFSSKVDSAVEAAIDTMRAAGAVIVDPVRIASDLEAASVAEHQVLLFEFKHCLNAYLAGRNDVALNREGFPRTLAGLIAFNEAHRDQELRFFGQDLLLESEACGPLTDPGYLDALGTSRRLSGPDGIDAVLDDYELDALIMPTGGPAAPTDLVNGDPNTLGTSSPAARCGYPLISVPAGLVCGLPVNVTFAGRQFAEALLIKLAFAFEQAAQARRSPKFLPTLALD